MHIMFIYDHRISRNHILYMSMYLCDHTYLLTCTGMYVCMYVCMYVYVYVQVPVCDHTHTFNHIACAHTYIRVRFISLKCSPLISLTDVFNIFSLTRDPASKKIMSTLQSSDVSQYNTQ